MRAEDLDYVPSRVSVQPPVGKHSTPLERIGKGVGAVTAFQKHILSQDAKKLLSDALQLPEEARAALAGSLLDSLDRAVDEDAEDALRKEIDARVKQLDSGAVKPIPWAEARKQILSATPDEATD